MYFYLPPKKTGGGVSFEVSHKDDIESYSAMFFSSDQNTFIFLNNNKKIPFSTPLVNGCIVFEWRESGPTSYQWNSKLAIVTPKFRLVVQSGMFEVNLSESLSVKVMSLV